MSSCRLACVLFLAVTSVKPVQKVSLHCAAKQPLFLDRQWIFGLGFWPMLRTKRQQLSMAGEACKTRCAVHGSAERFGTSADKGADPEAGRSL